MFISAVKRYQNLHEFKKAHSKTKNEDVFFIGRGDHRKTIKVINVMRVKCDT